MRLSFMKSLEIRLNVRLILVILLSAFALILLIWNVNHSKYIIKNHSLWKVNSTSSSELQSENETRVEENDIPDSREFKSYMLALEFPTQPPTREQTLKTILKCLDQPLELKKLLYGNYWLLKNYIRGSISTTIGCADSITYTTNGDFKFFDNLPILASLWKAPISFAVFAPGYDFNSTLDSIQYVRYCLPESDLIRAYVTFHIYFPSAHMPNYVPSVNGDLLDWAYNCDITEPPYEIIDRNEMYKTRNNLTYPINVGRNIARKAANTHFILASDIELFPSAGLIDQFLEMVKRNSSLVLEGTQPRVFPLPVFEVQKNVGIPTTKSELKDLFQARKAIYFHARVCSSCHMFPNFTQWFNVTDESEMTVFSITKREDKFKYWEPFYISDNKEPIFDERVTWEGQSNKRIQGYAMCLLNYEYHVLSPAFLVHSPGIKKFDPHSPRLKYVPPMNKIIYKIIEPEYRILFGTNSKCRT